MIANYQRSVLQLIKTTLKMARKDKGDISDIIVSGGSSRIPKVQEMIQNYFRGKRLMLTYQTDEALVEGAGKFLCNNIFF